jgi:hypothetical protein
MRSGLPIRLALDPRCRMPTSAHDRLYFGISESPPWDKSLEHLRTVALPSDDAARFDVAAPGYYDVIVVREHVEADGSTTATPCYDVEAKVAVQDLNEEQRLVIAPDPKCWNQLLQSLGEGN